MYSQSFYAGYAAGSRSSARRVVGWFSETLGGVAPLRSVLDVGCGIGTWLAEWQAAGVEDLRGLDGDYVEAAQLQVPKECFSSTDLTKPFSLGRRFDLVVSVEVAEHLPGSAADTFVAQLAGHGDLLLFSAAIPGQGGIHHVNEQWPSYWVEKFSEHGFSVFDYVRPALWSDRSVESWYRQNLLVFGRGEVAERLAALDLATFPELDVVHPAFFTQKMEGCVTTRLKPMLRALPGAVATGIRQHSGRAQ